MSADPMARHQPNATTAARAHGSPVLRLNGYVSVAAVHAELIACPDLTTNPSTASIDLSAALEFDVAAILMLFAAISTRRQNALRTELKLPVDQPARHILRLWQFPRAAAIAAGMPFRKLVADADLRYFGEDLPRLRVRDYARSPRASVLAHLVERQHFGLFAHRSSADNGLAQMMDLESARWRRYAIIQLLDKVLLGPASDVGRVLVQELVANAVEHPRCATAVVGSQMTLVPHSHHDAPAELTIAAWDDGCSIEQTLRQCLDAGTPVRLNVSSQPDTFKVIAEGWTPTSNLYRSDWTPTTASPDPELLLSSLFPGITRKASREADLAGNATDQSSNAGYGLYSLYKTTIDAFQGSVEMRSGRTILVVNRSHERPEYDVRLTVESALPALAGGLVVVRLPVRDA